DKEVKTLVPVVVQGDKTIKINAPSTDRPQARYVDQHCSSTHDQVVARTGVPTCYSTLPPSPASQASFLPPRN
ncbi:hypothetical protein U1Q18_051045, partial [Sarracenia purpurea var. burkii]